MPKSQHEKLTQDVIATLPEGMHSDGGNLYLLVRGDGRFWIFRYRANGKRHDMGLGSATHVSLERARKAAAECRMAVRDGFDPVEERRRRMFPQPSADAITAAVVAERERWVNICKEVIKRPFPHHRMGHYNDGWTDACMEIVTAGDPPP
jgi:hypothetical protein